jgi:membrane protein DedA with SNARE-associated domain
MGGAIPVALAILGIYLEESGVPMPVPSEVSIGYLGGRLHGDPIALGLAWLGLTALIVLGSTNLFAASRRFGPRMLGGRLAIALHLTPERIEWARRWFRRWGPFAIALSRFVPGLRWAMAVACGTMGVSYRMYWLSAGVSAAVWSALLLTLGTTFADPIAHFVSAHPWIVLLLPMPATLVIGTTILRLLGNGRAARFPLAARPSSRRAGIRTGG